VINQSAISNQRLWDPETSLGVKGQTKIFKNLKNLNIIVIISNFTPNLINMFPEKYEKY